MAGSVDGAFGSLLGLMNPGEMWLVTLLVISSGFRLACMWRASEVSELTEHYLQWLLGPLKVLSLSLLLLHIKENGHLHSRHQLQAGL